jgi:hypothetical protein
MSHLMLSPFCCDAAMKLTGVVPPVGGPYGLQIYVCLKCDRTRDLLIPAHDFRA